MRFHFSSVLRTLYTLSNLTRSRASNPAILLNSAPHRATSLRSMPIPLIGGLFSSKASDSSKMSYPVQKSDDEWRAVLNKEQFRILREKGTETPGSGKFDKHAPSAGVYTCAGCDAPLYKASHKFNSGCGWPAYFDSIPGAVKRFEDTTMFMKRIEIVCSNCGGHLGHVFQGEGFPTPTDERHCVNSVSLNFSPDDAPVQKATGGEGKKE
ncbi:hypothetical protein FJTKL_09768 [Diaporthe vaccinii]|uniref:Peptide-methionine (R)-S-oxide reductase n=3 Tax=Diaporthe vaccinii TaxID=105482 RepID=A0ABR4EMR4_9PEZI